MKVKTCLLDYCDNTLDSLGAVATGLCDRHIQMLESNKSYVGICWKCHRLEIISEIPRHLKGAFTEKYLFTYGCSHCTENLPDYQWLTMSKFKPNERLAVNASGQLVQEVVTEQYQKEKER